VTTFQPLGDKVLIDPVGGTGKEETDSGLIVHKDWDPQIMGTVLAVGDGLKCKKCGTRTHIPVKAGDQVLFSYEAGEYRVIEEGTEHLIMPVSQILAVIGEGE